MHHSALVSIAFLGAIPLSILCFLVLPPRRATLVSYLLCWLFLPVATIDVPGFIDIDKAAVTAVGVLCGFAVGDFSRLTRLRLSALDLPMLVWCLCPMLTSLDNGLGAYDGASNIINRVLTWGVPYLMGRLYFADLEGLRELAIGLVVGGLLYVPLCLWEVRMSPQLHTQLYGFYQHSGGFAQAVRGGGFRPLVFMHHGLMVGLWMSVTTLVAVVLWRSGALRGLFGIPMSWLVGALAVTALLCKSAGALVLMAGGLGALWFARRFRTALPIVVLALAPVAWSGLRGSGVWGGESILSAVAAVASERGTESLAYRMEAEDLLSAKSREHPLFGWGGFGRGLVPWEKGPGGMVVADGLWIIAFNLNGVLGLGALLGIALVPLLAFLRRIHARAWSVGALAPAGALAMVLAVYFVDNLLNAMVNPVYTLIAGGLTGLVLRARILPERKGPKLVPAPRRAARTRMRPLCELPIGLAREPQVEPEPELEPSTRS